MHLSITTPSRTLFRGSVDSATFPGVGGRFQVLKDHAALLGSLAAGELTYALGGQVSRLQVERGFVSVHDNEVQVLCELSEVA